MMKSKWLFFLLGLMLLVLPLAAAGIITRTVSAQDDDIPSPYDLLDTVNQYRVSVGLNTLTANQKLMTSAYKHSEYQAFLGTWTHTGPGGSNETDRAVAEGYGNGEKVICDEAVAVASVGQTADYIVYTLWDDYEHRDLVLLNARYDDAGVGMVEKDGLVYVTLNVCVVTGGIANTPRPTSAQSKPTNTGAAPSQPTGTATLSNIQIPLKTVTPLPDGSIIHVVQSGQTMWDIAIAYDMKVVDLATMNGISPSNPIVYVNQEILVRVSFTPTQSPTVTETPKPPTRTPKPTRTPRPTKPSSTVTVTSTITPQPVLPEIPALKNIRQRELAIAIIVVSALGLIIVIGASGGPRIKKDDDKDS